MVNRAGLEPATTGLKGRARDALHYGSYWNLPARPARCKALPCVRSQVCSPRRATTELIATSKLSKINPPCSGRYAGAVTAKSVVPHPRFELGESGF